MQACDMSLKVSRPLACDSCHAYKEKCIYEVPGLSEACRRCIMFKRQCITTRTRMMRGRRRRPETMQTQPQPGVQFVWFDSRGLVAESSEPSVPSSPPNVVADTVEKSISGETHTQEKQTWEDILHPADFLTPSNPLLAGLQPKESMLLDMAFNKDCFMQHFILSSNFANFLLGAPFKVLYRYPEVLLKSFLACSEKFARNMGLGNLDTSPDDGYANGTKAIMSLRSAGARVPLDTCELVALILLSVGMITFDIMDSGLSAHSISRYTLDLVQQSRSHIGLNAAYELSEDLVPLVHLDLVNCVIRRQLPISNFPARDTRHIDPYLGICGSLFPYLFEICNISHAIGSLEKPEQNMGVKIAPQLDARLSAVETAIMSWEPRISTNTSIPLTQNERQVVELQAKIHQDTFLLLIHRLRNVFGGEKDHTAKQLARQVFARLGTLYLQASKPVSSLSDAKEITAKKSFCDYRVAFPFLVAAIEAELPSERSEALAKIHFVMSPVLYPNAVNMLKNFLSFIWSARENQRNLHWFDLASSGPPLILF
jgi:hypothetical protein